MIRKILALIDRIPLKERAGLDGLTFIVEKDCFKMIGGSYVRAQYFRDNSIVFYKLLIHSDVELKEVLIHELCHHFGMNEKQVEKYMKG